MIEKGISELLVAFAAKYKYKYKIKDKMVLVFSVVPIENYDSRLEMIQRFYKNQSLLTMMTLEQIKR